MDSDALMDFVESDTLENEDDGIHEEAMEEGKDQLEDPEQEDIMKQKQEETQGNISQKKGFKAGGSAFGGFTKMRLAQNMLSPRKKKMSKPPDSVHRLERLHVRLDRFDEVVVITRLFSQANVNKLGVFIWIHENWGFLEKRMRLLCSQTARLRAEMDWGDIFIYGNTLENVEGTGRRSAVLSQLDNALINYLFRLDFEKENLFSRTKETKGKRNITREIEELDDTREVAFAPTFFYVGHIQRTHEYFFLRV
ncbi:hypothetical protein Bca4012_010936 [Brassica carinata]